MRALLESLLLRVVEQQKFAEAKNGAIATISGAAGAALITAYSIRSGHANAGNAALSLLAAGMFFTALVVAFASFLPQLNNALNPPGRSGAPKNLYFFEDLRSMSEDELLDAFAKSEASGNIRTRVERDLANQIIVHSQITSAKYRLFRTACYVALAGLLCVILMLGLEVRRNLVAANTAPDRGGITATQISGID